MGITGARGPVERVLTYLPVLLVPLAWSFVGLALFTSRLSGRTFLIGLVVMCVLFAVFVVQPGMARGVLRVWRLVLVGGLVATVVDVALLATGRAGPLLGVSLYAWLVLPALALVRTARVSDDRGVWYLGTAAVAGVGVVAVLAWTPGPGPVALGVAGMGLVAVGQAASVALAAAQNRP